MMWFESENEFVSLLIRINVVHFCAARQMSAFVQWICTCVLVEQINAPLCSRHADKHPCAVDCNCSGINEVQVRVSSNVFLDLNS